MNMKQFTLTLLLLMTVLTSMAQCKQLEARQEIHDLVVKYALFCDAHQYDRFREIFAPDIQITIHNQGRTSKFEDLEQTLTAFKHVQPSAIEFHNTGQTIVEFSDEAHARGTVYLTALRVNKKEDGKEQVENIYLTYYDTYEQRNGRWWITSRDQHFLFYDIRFTKPNK